MAERGAVPHSEGTLWGCLGGSHPFVAGFVSGSQHERCHNSTPISATVKVKLVDAYEG